MCCFLLSLPVILSFFCFRLYHSPSGPPPLPFSPSIPRSALSSECQMKFKGFKLTNYFRCLPTLPAAVSDPLSLSVTRGTYGTSSTLFILPRLPSHSSHRLGLTTVRPYFMSSSHPSTCSSDHTPQKMRKQICDTCHTYHLKHGCRRPIGLNKIRSRKRASKLRKLGQSGR